MNGDCEAQFWENMRTAKENDAVSRQMALDKIAEYFGDLRVVVHHDMLQLIKELPSAQPEVTEEAVKEYCRKRCLCIIDSALLKKYASAQPDSWMEQNKDKILQAGKEGREVEFRIGGRLFAIREKAQ